MRRHTRACSRLPARAGAGALPARSILARSILARSILARSILTRLLMATLVSAAALAPAAPLAPLAAQQPEDRAAAAWNAGEHDTARELYRTRVAADSADVQALHRLGLLHAWNRDFATAIPLLQRVVALAPSRDARLDLARVLSWSGRFGEAEAAYGAVLGTDPDDADALRGMARVTTWRGDLAGGERHWRNLLAADPQDAEAHVGLSQVLRWRGRSRDALEHARTAARLKPGDRDAAEQLAWAEAAFRSRFAPTFSAETDSDDNRLYTAALSASGHVQPRLALVLNAYVRRADGPAPAVAEATRETWSVSGGARVEAGAGWILSGTGGVVHRPEQAGGALGIFRGGIASPAWRPVTATVGIARSALDVTADLMGRDIVTDEASLGAGARLSSALRVDAGVALTRFRGLTVNDRLLGRLGLEARPAQWLRVRPRATAFRFDETVLEGYFAPDQYVLGELGLGVERHGAAWSFTGEVAPGAQRIGSDGDMKGALSGRMRIGYTVAPGREVGVGVSFSNLGIERFQAGSAGYRYQAAVLSAAWGF
jgi:tetratricopeptide (TPR) repeat protein